MQDQLLEVAVVCRKLRLHHKPFPDRTIPNSSKIALCIDPLSNDDTPRRVPVVSLSWLLCRDNFFCPTNCIVLGARKIGTLRYRFSSSILRADSILASFRPSFLSRSAVVMTVSSALSVKYSTVFSAT